MIDDPLELRLAARRNRAARSRLLLLVGVVLLAAVAAAVGVALAVSRHRDAGDSPQVVRGGPPDDWTHAELAAHLRKRGVPAEIESGGGSFGGVVYSRFADPATKQKVSVDLAADAKAARELAGSNPKSFAWGRFVITRTFSDSQPYADRIREALR